MAYMWFKKCARKKNLNELKICVHAGRGRCFKFENRPHFFPLSSCCTTLQLSLITDTLISRMLCGREVYKWVGKCGRDVQAKSHPHRGTGGEGWCEACCTRWGTYHGFRAAGGLWRHSRCWPFWAPSWILPKIRNCQKTVKIWNILCGTCRIWHS